jgi:hypothetical protein
MWGIHVACSLCEGWYVCVCVCVCMQIPMHVILFVLNYGGELVSVQVRLLRMHRMGVRNEIRL